MSAVAFGSFLLVALAVVRYREKHTEKPIGVLFDLDGTLLDFEGSSHNALNAPLIGKRFPGDETKRVTWKLHAQIVGKPKTAWSNEILTALEVSAEDCTPEQYAREWHEAICADFPTMQLLPGALELVAKLKQVFPQIKLAIATSSEAENFKRKMAFHPQLLEKFDAVVTGDQVQNGKPAPDIFLLAAQRIGIDPKRCIVFEDSPSGILAGKRAGCVTVAIPDGRMEGNEHLFPSISDIVVSSLVDMVSDERLRGLWNRLSG